MKRFETITPSGFYETTLFCPILKRLQHTLETNKSPKVRTFGDYLRLFETRNCIKINGELWWRRLVIYYICDIVKFMNDEWLFCVVLAFSLFIILSIMRFDYSYYFNFLSVCVGVLNIFRPFRNDLILPSITSFTITMLL